MTSVSKIKSHRLDVPQQNDFNQEEVLDEQQFLDQERNFIVVQVEADCSQIKEEQEDVCISQEGEQFGLKQETQTFEGKRKRSNTKQDLSTIFASMQEAEREQHCEQMELQWQHQREQRELQRQQLELNSLLVDEVRQSREAEVVVRREEIAQNAALNNTFMAVFETLARRV
ncbi:uncharacterized protein KZ484_011993 [Pholidichthys leucotaenia]